MLNILQIVTVSRGPDLQSNGGIHDHLDGQQCVPLRQFSNHQVLSHLREQNPHPIHFIRNIVFKLQKISKPNKFCNCFFKQAKICKPTKFAGCDTNFSGTGLAPPHNITWAFGMNEEVACVLPGKLER